MQRYGDWNAKNRELLAETEALGGNKYYHYYQQLIKKNMERDNPDEPTIEEQDAQDPDTIPHHNNSSMKYTLTLR